MKPKRPPHTPKPRTKHPDELRLRSLLACLAFAALVLVLLVIGGLILSGRPVEALVVGGLAALLRTFLTYLVRLAPPTRN